jgi:hypothetical protein
MSCLDLYNDYPGFLEEVAEWIQVKKAWTKPNLACNFIRDSGSKVFLGVGVYTICEVFFMAGALHYHSNILIIHYRLYANIKLQVCHLT